MLVLKLVVSTRIQRQRTRGAVRRPRGWIDCRVAQSVRACLLCVSDDEKFGENQRFGEDEKGLGEEMSTECSLARTHTYSRHHGDERTLPSRHHAR